MRVEFGLKRRLGRPKPAHTKEVHSRKTYSRCDQGGRWTGETGPVPRDIAVLPCFRRYRSTSLAESTSCVHLPEAGRPMDVAALNQNGLARLRDAQKPPWYPAFQQAFSGHPYSFTAPRVFPFARSVLKARRSRLIQFPGSPLQQCFMRLSLVEIALDLQQQPRLLLPALRQLLMAQLRASARWSCSILPCVCRWQICPWSRSRPLMIKLDSPDTMEYQGDHRSKLLRKKWVSSKEDAERAQCKKKIIGLPEIRHSRRMMRKLPPTRWK